jgi:hypothetical protein
VKGKGVEPGAGDPGKEARLMQDNPIKKQMRQPVELEPQSKISSDPTKTTNHRRFRI